MRTTLLPSYHALLVGLTLLLAASAVCAFSSSTRTRLVPLTEKGRVEDPIAWVDLCSRSLVQLTDQSLAQHLSLAEDKDIHEHSVYAFLSHGSQEDPIFCYFNKAAMEMFQYDRDEIYKLPSRYSAPSGAARQTRQKVIDGTAEEDKGYYYLPPVIRQAKNGDLYEISDILLWNVYDDEGYRLGQAAIYDRSKAVFVGNEPRVVED